MLKKTGCPSCVFIIMVFILLFYVYVFVYRKCFCSSRHFRMKYFILNSNLWRHNLKGMDSKYLLFVYNSFSAARYFFTRELLCKKEKKSFQKVQKMFSSKIKIKRLKNRKKVGFQK